MSKKEMVALIETMNNYDELAAKAKAKADAIREAIKEEMVRLDTEELTAGAYIVRFTNVISNRFDSTTFKRLYSSVSFFSRLLACAEVYFIVIRPLPSIPLCLCSSGSRRGHTAALRLRHSAAGTIPTTVCSASPA